MGRGRRDLHAPMVPVGMPTASTLRVLTAQPRVLTAQPRVLTNPRQLHPLPPGNPTGRRIL